MPSKFTNKFHLMSVVAASAVALLAGSLGVYAQMNPATSAPTKGWVDPGSLERAKTQPATDQAAPAPQTGSSNTADTGKGGAPKSQTTTAPAESPKAADTGSKAVAPTDQKQKAVESDKLQDLIRSSERTAADKKARDKASAHLTHPAAHHAKENISRRTGEAHAAAPRSAPGNVTKKAALRHIAYENLPNKKDGPAVSAPEGQFDPFSGYRQPIHAAY